MRCLAWTKLGLIGLGDNDNRLMPWVRRHERGEKGDTHKVICTAGTVNSGYQLLASLILRLFGDGEMAGCLGGELTTGRSFPWNGERRRQS